MSVIHTEVLSFIYNFVADYILLFFVRKDLFLEIKLKQVIKGAAACSITYIIWNNIAAKESPYCKIFLGYPIIIILLCLFFKIHSVKLLIKTVVIFLLYMFLLAGSITFFLSCINIESVTKKETAYKAMGMLMLNAILLLLWKYRKKNERVEKALQSNTYEIQILRKGKKIICKAMYDSGNLLSSEITGQGVCIIPVRQAKPLLSKQEWEAIRKFGIKDTVDIDYDKNEQAENTFSWKTWMKQLQSGIYVLHYSTVGRKNATMPGIIAEEIVVLKDKEVLVRTKGMLGISQGKVSEKNKFSVLLPVDIFEREKNHSII